MARTLSVGGSASRIAAVYDRAPTQAIRIRRTTMPMTLATTSRNESKLNAIFSRLLRRRRYMTASVVQVLAGHGHPQGPQLRVDMQIASHPVGRELEADQRPIRWLTGLDGLLPAGDQALDVGDKCLVGERCVVSLPPVLLAAGEDRDVVAEAGDGDDEIAVPEHDARRRRRWLGIAGARLCESGRWLARRRR